MRCIWGSTRRGLTRGEESEEGGDSVHEREDGAKGPLHFFNVFGGSKNRCKNGTQTVTKMVPKRDPKSEQKSEVSDSGSGPKSQIRVKWPEMGLELSPGLKNPSK